MLTSASATSISAVAALLSVLSMGVTAVSLITDAILLFDHRRVNASSPVEMCVVPTNRSVEMA